MLAEYLKSEYEFGKLIDGEAMRGMFIDRQLGHFWAVIRAFRHDGSSRLVWEGKIDTQPNIEKYRERFKVLPALTFMDAHYQPQIVYSLCARMGYTATIGSGESGFRHPSRKPGVKGPLMPFTCRSKRSTSARRVAAGSPSQTWLSRTCWPTCAPGVAWRGRCPKTHRADYLKQIDSEVRKRIQSKVTKEISERWVQRGGAHRITSGIARCWRSCSPFPSVCSPVARSKAVKNPLTRLPKRRPEKCGVAQTGEQRGAASRCVNRRR